MLPLRLSLLARSLRHIGLVFLGGVAYSPARDEREKSKQGRTINAGKMQGWREGARTQEGRSWAGKQCRNTNGWPQTRVRRLSKRKPRGRSSGSRCWLGVWKGRIYMTHSNSAVPDGMREP